MSLEFRKLRLMWKEKLDTTVGEDINFLFSLDSGSRWHSFANVLSRVRAPSSSNAALPYASYTAYDDELNSIDFTVPLLFNSVPKISSAKSSTVIDTSENPTGLPAGEYYIKVATISGDYVGMSETSTPVAAVSFPSAAEKFNLTSKGSINLAVQYDDLAKGIAIYIGKETTLTFSATISATSTHTVVFDSYKAKDYNGTLTTEFGTFYGDSFITSITSMTVNRAGTYLDIDKDQVSKFEFVTDTTKTDVANKLVLTLVKPETNDTNELKADDEVVVEVGVVHYRLAFISNLSTKLAQSIVANDTSAVYLSSRYYLPASGTIKVDSETIDYTTLAWDLDKQCYKLTGLTRSSKETAHSTSAVIRSAYLDGGTYGELPRKDISVYQDSDGLIQYFNFESSAYSEKVIDLTGNTDADIVGTVSVGESDSFLKNSIYFNKGGILVTSFNVNNSGSIHFYFKIDTIPSEDMVLFGSEDSIRLKLNHTNLRLSLEFNEDTIIPSTSPKLSKVQIGKWTEIAITWQYSSTFSANKVYFYKDGVLEQDESYSISNGDYTIALGALLTNTGDEETDVEYESSFIGKIDDWRVYNTCLSLEDLTNIDANLKEYGYEYCGTIKLDKSFVVGANDPKGQSEGDIMDYSLFDSELLKYDPYIPTYFSVLIESVDDVDTAGEYKSECDLSVLAAINNGNLIDKDLILDYYSNIDGDYGYCLLKNTASGIKYVPRINYPAEIDSIKYRFALTGKSDGMSTPIIKDFVAIASTSSIDFD